MPDRKNEDKPVVTELTYGFGRLIKKTMFDENFPFDNLKLFIEISCYDKIIQFNEIKSNPSELKKFREKIEIQSKELFKKNLIPKIYGWKPEQ